MSTGNRSVAFGLAGLGGFAGYICDRLLDAHHSPEPAARLLAVFEPELERFEKRAHQLQDLGVRLAGSYEELLEFQLDAVWLPLPIDLHCSFTVAAVSAGKAVVCEKPAAGCVDDVDSMIAARDRARRQVHIGFQDLYQPCVPILKRRLLRGDLGRPVAASVIGCWPRSSEYFSRNQWAGRLRRHGRWVMDSPVSNALSHFLHLALFLLGPTAESAASPVEVAAELYRANAIENYDTCAMRFTLDGDVPLLVACTHACETSVEPVITIESERGRIRYLAGRHAEVRVGTHTEVIPLLGNPYPRLLEGFQDYLHGGRASGSIAATLETARAHVVAVNAASEAAAVHDVPAEFIDVCQADSGPVHAIRGIVPAMQYMTDHKCLLSETELLPWSRPPQRKQIHQYTHFAGPKQSNGRPTVADRHGQTVPVVAIHGAAAARREGEPAGECTST